MQKLLSILFLFCFLLLGCSKSHPDYHPQEGDLVFQSFPMTPLTDMIEGATGSKWSHCGIVIRDHDDWKVLEAVGPVKNTDLNEWLGRSRESRFSVFRLKQEYQKHIPSLIQEARQYLGRPYDVQYDWSDEKIYCSELVYKAFESASGEKLGVMQKVEDLNWKPYEHLIRQLNEGIVPRQRELITPRAITESPDVTMIYSENAD